MRTHTKALKFLTAATLLAVGAAASPVWAQGYSATPVEQGSFRDHARVTRVEPLYRTVEVSSPVQQCWEEPVTVHQQRYAHHGHGGGHRGRSYTGPIVGGVVGGLIGNQFGGGDGRTLLTVAGAVLGASIGNDASNRNYRRHQRRHSHGTSYTTTERRCSTTHQVSQRRERDGYLVEYRYKGRSYTARTDYDPGDRIAVDVQVVPAQ